METMATYGCSHPEHPLCLYVVLEAEDRVRKFTDLISGPASKSIAYACPTCNQVCSLDFCARDRLYADCIKIMSSCPAAMQRAYITALPSYLLKKLVETMGTFEGIDFFAQLPPEKFWEIVKKLPIASWKNYKKMLNKADRKKIEEAKPPDVLFMLQSMEERMAGFKKFSCDMQREILITFWPELSTEEVGSYLEIIFEKFKADSAGVDGRAGLFAALIANHNPPSEERFWLFSQLIPVSMGNLNAKSILPFFTTNLSVQELHDQALAAYKRLSNAAERAALLVALWPKLTEKERENLLTVILKKADKTLQPRAFSEIINVTSRPYYFAKKIACIAKGAEEGAAFLDEIWGRLKSSQRDKLAVTLLSLPVTSLFKQYHILSVLGGLSSATVFRCVKKLLQEPLSTDQAHALVKANVGKINQQGRYAIYKTILKNRALNPSPKKLVKIFAPFPYDLCYTCMKKGLKRFTDKSQAEKFLGTGACVLTLQQRIRLLKEFMQTRNLSVFDISGLLIKYSDLHKRCYADSSSFFYAFFNGLPSQFDEIFAAWDVETGMTQIYATKLAVEFWPLIPEEKQKQYFNLLSPAKRDFLLRTFSWNKKLHNRLQKFSAVLSPNVLVQSGWSG
ncbi:MAG: hypothetical protein M1549_00330 [Candidatus Dependentiae bacterium]|nr:hypothetical protein [Candidatus Dependentiae bacterium]